MNENALASRRLALIRAHMDAENRLDFDAAIETFDHPHYELVGTGETFTGAAAVRDYYRRSRAAFPDQRNEIIGLYATGEAVIVEFWLMGTHLGPLPLPNGELAPTGREMRVKMCAVFEFAGEKIAAERIYFDRMTLLAQLAG